MTTDPEAGARAIVEAARARRPRTPRWVWIAAVVVGGACALALGLALLITRDAPAGGLVRPPGTSGGHGFGAGVVVGALLGLVAGVGLGRARERR